jgi:hypothetical protein
MQNAMQSTHVSLEREIVLGLLRHTQERLPVKDFPPIGHPSWDALWFHISTDSQFVGSLSRVPPFAALAAAINTDPVTKRVSIDLAGPHGRRISESSPELAHHLFKIAWEIRDFIEVC